MGGRNGAGVGVWAIAAGAAISLVVCLYNYFDAGSGVAGSGGAALVIASSALILFAALVLALARSLPRWRRVTLDALLLLGVLGTGLAVYMLEAPVALAAMGLALIGWLIHIFDGAPARTTPLRGASL